MTNNFITINNKEFKTEIKEIPVSELKFYPENPRVYSVLNVNNQEPSQEEIFNIMKTLDSVKELKEDIKKNGGLIDPLIVRGSDNVVVEGNSRLAAYIILSRSNAIKWGKVKCEVLPDEISDDEIFTLLGTYHIKGKDDWEPYEQAGYLYRRHKTTKKPIKSIAEDVGLTKIAAERMINAYDAMVKHNDTEKSHFSYYYEYYKNPNIKKVREKQPALDEVIIEQVIDGTIENSQDIRKLGKIAELSEKKKDSTAKKIMTDIINNDTDIYQGFDRLKQSGKLDDAYIVLNKFRQRIVKKEFEQEIQIADKDKVLFEINKTINKLEQLKKKLKEENNE